MKFGFDIDDTLINLREHAFHIYNKTLKKNVNMDVFHQLKRLEIHELFGLNEQEGKKMWNHLLEEIYFTNCPPFEGAVELLNQLVQEEHEVYYITSRMKKYCTQTKDWMRNVGFPVKDEHFFCGMKDSEKVKIIASLQLDYYVDDKPNVLETLQDIPTNIILRDQSYNKQINLPRLTDWTQFHTFIKS